VEFELTNKQKSGRRLVIDCMHEIYAYCYSAASVSLSVSLSVR